MTARIAAKFAKDKQDMNGLDHIADRICEDRNNWRGIAVVRLDCLRVTDEIDQGGVEIPTVRVLQIEPLAGTDADTAHKLLDAAYEHRTGRVPLPDPPSDERPAIEHDPSQCGPVYADEHGKELVGYCTEPAGHDNPAKGKGTGHRYRDDWTEPTQPAEKG